MKVHKHSETHVVVDLHSVEFIKLLNNLGFNHHSASQKVVPESIYQWDNENISAFVAGYIDSDGAVVDSESNGNVAITSTSRELLLGICRLFAQFLGVQASVSSEMICRNSYVEGEHIRYQLRTSGDQEKLRRIPSEKIFHKTHWARGRRKYFYSVSNIEDVISDVVALGVDGEEFIADGFVSHNSRESIQQLMIAGVPSELLSVDRTANEYKQFCNLIYNHRISFYHHPVMDKELFELIYFRGNNKVDHPDQGSKDLMDGLVGAVTNALNSDEIINQQRSGDAKVLLNVYKNLGF